jgi:hypothetical protein
MRYVLPLPSEHPPTPQWDHTIIRSVCAGHDFPIHEAEGVSLWFSGQRLLTDGTSENAVIAKFVHNVHCSGPKGLGSRNKP